MKIKKVMRLIILTLIISIPYSLSQSVADDSNIGIIFICHPSVPILSLSKSDIKNIFLGRKIKWNNNDDITFVILKDSNIHRYFTQTYCEKKSFQFRNYWRRQVFTGLGRIPKSFTNENKLIDYISNTKGAIGYISLQTPPKSVRIITISEK